MSLIGNRLKFQEFDVTIFLFSFSWLGLNWLALFPALYSWDIITYLEGIVFFNSFPGKMHWESYWYEWYIYLFSLITPRLTAATLFQIILFAILVTQINSLLKKIIKSNWIAFFVTTLIIFAPANVFFTLMTERDTLFAIFGCYGTLELIKQRFEFQSESAVRYFLKAFIYFSLMACMRKEGVLILLVLPLFFFFDASVNRIKKICMSYLFTLITIILFTALTHSQSREKDFGSGNHYNMNAFRNSFLYIISVKLKEIPEADLIVVNEFFDIKKLHDPQRMLYAGALEFKGVRDETRMQDLYKIFFRTFFRYPELFLEGRWKILQNTYYQSMFISPLSDKKPSAYDFAKNLRIFKKYELKSVDLFQGKMPFLKDYFFQSHIPDSFLFRISNPIFSVFSFVFILLLFPIIPRTASIVLVIALHTMVVFFASPGGSNKYYYLTYLTSFVLVPLAIFEVLIKAKGTMIWKKAKNFFVLKFR